MKPKRRIISFLLAFCLVVGLMPTAAFAAGTDTGKAIQLGTSGISDPTSTQDSSGTYYTPSDYVYFGVNGSDPIKWRVLDADKTNDGTTSGMFLLSEYLLASDVVFESAYNSNDNDGQANPNDWQYSNAQNWCNTFATNPTVFSTVEQAAFLGVAKTDSAESALYSRPWGISSLTDNDKVFFLSVRELADYVGNYNKAPGLIAKTGESGSAGEWWLRSPDASYTYYAGMVESGGTVLRTRVDFVEAARPAFNLNLDSVLFTSDAVGGKQGTTGTVAEISTSNTAEWKLTLQDNNRNFSVTEDAAAGKPGDTITLNYSGATTGANEYISVIIIDNGNATHYGRITQPSSDSGTVDVTIPANLAEGTYTLNVFSEQYNGDKKTDYASAFETVTLTVEHSWETGWSSDSTGHWYACSGCDDKKDYAPHSGTADSDCTTATVCVCGHVITPAEADHSYDDDHDTTCNATGCTAGEREKIHAYGADWKSDKDNHWHECSCGDKKDTAAHTTKVMNVKEATTSEKGYTGDTVCEVCGYEIAKGEDIPVKAMSPETGDNSNMFLWIALLFISGGVITILTVVDRKRKAARM